MMMAGLSTIATALAYYVIGSWLIYFSIRVWMIHPVNRVFIFGDYLTPKGVRVVMASWPLVSLFGLFIFSCAAEHHLSWLREHGWIKKMFWVQFTGWTEAVISVFTAIVVTFLAVQWLRSSGKWPRH